MELIRESLVCNIKGCSSASQSLKLARCIGLKSKLNSAFVLDSYRVVETLRDEEKVGHAKEKWPARWFGRLGGGIR